MGGDYAGRKYIANIVGRNVVDSNKTKIPTFDKLRKNDEVSSCGIHSTLAETEVTCALQRTLLAQVQILSLAPRELRNPETSHMSTIGKERIDNEGKFISYNEID